MQNRYPSFLKLQGKPGEGTQHGMEKGMAGITSLEIPNASSVQEGVQEPKKQMWVQSDEEKKR